MEVLLLTYHLCCPSCLLHTYRTNTNPGIVVKMDLTTFTRVGAVRLSPGEDQLLSAVASGNYAYFG